MAIYTLQPSNLDTWLDKFNPNVSYDGATWLPLYYDTGSYDSTALLKWDLSSIPAGIGVKSATLSLYVTQAPSNNVVNFYRCLRAWTSGATWNKYDGVNAWGTAGCKNNSTDYNNVSMANPTFASGVTGWKDIVLDPQEVWSLIQSNNGIVGISSSLTVDTRLSTREGANTPKLVIETVTGYPQIIMM